MAVSLKTSWIYENATKGLVGNAIKPGAAASGCDLATANTDNPLGIAIEEANQNDTLSVDTNRGDVLKAIASAAITRLNKVTATTGGKFATATKLAGTGIVVSAGEEYEWGVCLEAAANADELFQLLFSPQEVEQ